MFTTSFEHLIDGCSCHGKTCGNCHTTQCRYAFRCDKRNSDGLYGWCRSCQYIVRQNSRARRMGLDATLTALQWLDLKVLYGYRCLSCGKQEPEITLTLDHIIPLSQGGASTLANTQPLCLTCNKKKCNNSTDYRRCSNGTDQSMHTYEQKEA